MVKAKLLAAVILAPLIFYAGYEAATVRFERDIALEKERSALELVALEEKYRETEDSLRQSLVLAWDKANRASADLVRERLARDRLHDELKTVKRELSETAGHTVDVDRKRLAEALEYIDRYDAIASRAIELARVSVIKKDAVVRIVKP